jgi:replication factor C subunit 3/5
MEMNKKKLEDSLHLPWIEKYRPETLEDVISHGDIMSTLSKFMKDKCFPHLLFYGPPGTGKTTTILACARQMYGPRFNTMVLEVIRI